MAKTKKIEALSEEATQETGEMVAGILYFDTHTQMIERITRNWKSMARAMDVALNLKELGHEEADEILGAGMSSFLKDADLLTSFWLHDWGITGPEEESWTHKEQAF